MAPMLKDEQGGVPTEFQLFPFGEVEVEGAPSAIVDEQAMVQIIAGLKRRGNDLVIDYEHQTLSGAKAPAAGWITSLANRGKAGLWGLVNWTEAALKHLQKKEYRYFSPVFRVNRHDRRVIGIHSVALTNSPKINHLRPIVAKLDEVQDGLTVGTETNLVTANLPMQQSVYHQICSSDPDSGTQMSIEEAEELNRLMNVTWDDIARYGLK